MPPLLTYLVTKIDATQAHVVKTAGAYFKTFEVMIAQSLAKLSDDNNFEKKLDDWSGDLPDAKVLSGVTFLTSLKDPGVLLKGPRDPLKGPRGPFLI